MMFDDKGYVIRIIECEKCGASSFRKVRGVWTCNYCGASYIVDDECEKKIDYYTKKAETAFENGKYNKMYDYALKILELDPENSYAWLMQMYYYGMKNKPIYTSDIIDAGKKAILYEKEEIQDTRERVNKAFTEWGESGAFNARSHIEIFYKSVLESDSWKLPEQMSKEEKDKEYSFLPASASSQLNAATKALMEVETEFLTGEEFGKEFHLQSYYYDKYKQALYDCERAIRVMKKSYLLAGFERTKASDYKYSEDKMIVLWEKIGETRPSDEEIVKL